MAPKAKKAAPAAEVEDKKRKAEDKPAEEPAEKKPAKEEDVEQEKDALADKRPTLKTSVGFNAADTTLNVVPTSGGKVLMSINEGGMQYLIASARANVGIKSGRYMYEIKTIETLNPAEFHQQPRMKVNGSRQVVRVGFSTSASPTFLGDGEAFVYFDSDGFFAAGKSRTKSGAPFSRDQVMGIVLNLDEKSANANTVSLFRDGKRVSKPQPLPDDLKGKTLFPHISYRNVTVQVNMGPQSISKTAMPFSCRMIQDAATADSEEAKTKSAGKCEVVFPVAFPDEGTFEWLDGFLESHPGYVELSDRALQNWAQSSGLAKPRGGFGSSLDKPSFAYGLPSMEDMSLQRVVKAVAGILPRNYVVMEVKSNLIKEERGELLKGFSPASFKKVAHVVMGEPKADWKKKVHKKILEAKQDRATRDWNTKKTLKEQKKAQAAKAKELAQKRKEQEEVRKKALAEVRAKKEEELKKKAEDSDEKVAEAAKKELEKLEEDKKKEAEKEKEKAEAEAKKEEEEAKKAEEMEVDDLGDEPPKAELSEEEKKLWHQPKLAVFDVAPGVLSKAFDKFSLPEKEEGFDELKYDWQPAGKAGDYLKEWILKTKATTRIDDLQPSQYFKDKQAAWTKQVAEWKTKQGAFKKPANAKDTKQVDLEEVKNVADIGGGEPLFQNFGPEDWALLGLRHELVLLQDAFVKDVNDPDRTTIPENHFAFYYSKYYGKQLLPKMFDHSKLSDLLDMVKDTAVLEDSKLVMKTSADADDFAALVKSTEARRRERQRRIEAGDETVKLKFNATLANPPAGVTMPGPVTAATAATTAATGAKGGWNQGKGAGKFGKK
eukprot:TRINITY_DN78679_c0_g1_i1.p1 TRINITY_DN78679_c0_g1~~TRINITY_DN78679_c0_g1_i1.p1  ORF type:complete len:831 (+),score=302.87 TRINITY_DN78679_c0_g1_i1:92-2584(+)